MTSTYAIVGMVLAMLAVLGVLGAGLYTMVRGQDVTGRKTNRLMWYRIYFQAAALALFALALVLGKSNG